MVLPLITSGPSVTDPQIPAGGGPGVNVGLGVFDGVKLGVKVKVDVGVLVRVGVFVCVGVLVRVGVRVSVGVLVRVRVLVGPGVLVRVGVFVGVIGVGDFVAVGSTRSVFVAGIVEVGVGEMVLVGTIVGVEVIALCICCCACSSDTGAISSGVQYCPVIVHAMAISSSLSDSGSDGALIDSFPLAPPNSTLTCWPAPKYCSSPFETTLAEPS